MNNMTNNLRKNSHSENTEFSRWFVVVVFYYDDPLNVQGTPIANWRNIFGKYCYLSISCLVVLYIAFFFAKLSETLAKGLNPGVISKVDWVWSETHKRLERVTRVQCSWIFTFTLFGNHSDRYPSRSSTLFSSSRISGLFWNATKAVKFLLNFRYILHCMVKTITFLKGNSCILKCLIDVLQIFLFGAKEKLQNKPRFEMDFVLNFSMCSADFTCFNGSTIEIGFSKLL